MANAQEYYARIKGEREALAPQFKEGFCLMVSVHNVDKNTTGGSFCEVTVARAAQALVDGTHRLATPEETDAHRAQQDEQRARIAARDIEAAQRVFKGALGLDRLPNLPGPLKPPTK